MGVDKTKGHVQGQQGLRGHSCGETFPFVLYSQGTIDNLTYWVLQPNSLRIGPFKKWELAESFAARLKMFGQLEPEKPETADIIRYATETPYTYYSYYCDSGDDAVDRLHTPWRWRIEAGAGPDSFAEYTADSGKTWVQSYYRVREVRGLASDFVSIGRDPQWQEQ